MGILSVHGEISSINDGKFLKNIIFVNIRGVKNLNKIKNLLLCSTHLAIYLD